MSTKTYITLLAVIVTAVAAQVYTSDGIPYNPSQFQATSYFSPTTTIASLPEEITTLSASDGYGYGSSNATVTGSLWSNSTSGSNTAGGILTAPPPTDSMSGGLVTASPTPSASIVSSSSAMNTASQTSSTPTTSSAGATQSGDAASNSANALVIGLLGLAFSFVRL